MVARIAVAERTHIQYRSVLSNHKKVRTFLKWLHQYLLLYRVSLKGVEKMKNSFWEKKTFLFLSEGGWCRTFNTVPKVQFDFSFFLIMFLISILCALYTIFFYVCYRKSENLVFDNPSKLPECVKMLCSCFIATDTDNFLRVNNKELWSFPYSSKL